MADLPTVLGPAGLVPQLPATIKGQIASDAVALSPGLTNNLPGLLTEDILSTSVAAIVVADQARVDLVNSITPFGANVFLLRQLGVNVYGVPVQEPSNTSVLVVVAGPPGYVVPVGFEVSDGTYDYVARDGGIVQTGGQTAPLYFAATQSGAWAVPPGTVTEINSSYPNVLGEITCSNPYPGTPGLLSIPESEYRTRVLRAGRAAALGTPSYVRTQLTNVPGVQERLVSVQQQAGGGFKILCGGGDPYAVAFAIYSSVLDVTTLVRSVMGVGSISQAVDAVVTTTLNHGYVDGQVVTIAGAQGMNINGVPLTVAVIDEKTFSTGVSTVLLGAYKSGGVLSPNARNSAVTVADYPDTYEVRFVNPPQQVVSMTVLWGTTAQNYVNDGAVEQLAAPALAAYVNAIYVGQPLNVLEMDCAFRDAVASVLPSRLLVRLVFEVSINGVAAAPATGETIIAGDSESYCYCDPQGAGINVVRG